MSLDLPKPSPDVAHHRARVAWHKQNRQPGDPAIADAERDLRAAKLADHVRRIVDQAPQLTEAQRANIAAILRPVVSGEDGCAALARRRLSINALTPLPADQGGEA